MKTTLNYMLGIAMIVAAILGLLLSVVGLIGAITIRKPLVENLTNTLELFDDTLTATADGLSVVYQSLDQASMNVSTLEDTLQASGRAIQDTTPMFDTLTKMVQDDLPATITATQTSLTSAQTSAALIENALMTITSLPLIPGGPYNPKTPLNQALGQVSDSLTPLIDSFDSLEDSLKVSKGNLILMQAEINIMAMHIGQIQDQLDNAQSVIEQYQSVVSRLQEQVNFARESLPRWVNVLSLFAVLFFIWLAITQIGLLTQGLERMKPTLPKGTENS